MGRADSAPPPKYPYAVPRARGKGRSILSTGDWGQVRAELRLSPRELELVQHIFDGKKLVAIAADMHLALGTVKTYSQRIYAKLAVCDHRELTLAVINAYLQLLRPHE